MMRTMNRLRIAGALCFWMFVMGIAVAYAGNKRRVITIEYVNGKCRVDYEKVNISHQPGKGQLMVWASDTADTFAVQFKSLRSPCYSNRNGGYNRFTFEVPARSESEDCFADKDFTVKNPPEEFSYAIYVRNPDGTFRSCLDPAVIVTDGTMLMSMQGASMPAETRMPKQVDIDDKCQVDYPMVNLYKNENDRMRWTADVGTFDIAISNASDDTTVCMNGGKPNKFSVESTGVSQICQVNSGAKSQEYAYTITRTDVPNGCTNTGKLNVP